MAARTCSYSPSFHVPKCAFSLLLDVLSLSVFSNLFLSPRSMSDQRRARLEPTTARGRRRERGREGSRCLWQCGGSNEGPYDGETISKAWTHSPLAHTRTKQRGSNGLAKARGQSHWHTHTHSLHTSWWIMKKETATITVDHSLSRLKPAQSILPAPFW